MDHHTVKRYLVCVFTASTLNPRLYVQVAFPFSLLPPCLTLLRGQRTCRLHNHQYTNAIKLRLKGHGREQHAAQTPASCSSQTRLLMVSHICLHYYSLDAQLHEYTRSSTTGRALTRSIAASARRAECSPVVWGEASCSKHNV